MLSPHAFAILLLATDEGGHDSHEFTRKDVEALIERHLIRLERRGPCRCMARAALQGHTSLNPPAQARGRRRRSVPTAG